MKKILQISYTLILYIVLHKLAFSEIHEPTLRIHYEPLITATDTFYYGDDTRNGRYDINSDFGPRNVTTGSSWHLGVDFNFAQGNTDLGYHLKTIESGQIIRIYGRADRSVSLTMEGEHHFSYMHLFPNFSQWPSSGYVKSGDLLLIPYPENGDIPERQWAIMWTPVNGDTSVWGASTNPVDFNGSTFPVSNYLGEGHILGPLGNSGTGAAHLHISSYENVYDGYQLHNVRNPLYWIQHPPDSLNVIKGYPENYKVFRTDSLTEGQMKIGFKIDSRSDSLNPLNHHNVGGLDIDRVKIKLYTHFSEHLDDVLAYVEPSLKDSLTMVFNFGGQPDSTTSSNMMEPWYQTDNVIHSGVLPVSTTAGIDSFVFEPEVNDIIDHLGVGVHRAEAWVYDINGDSVKSTSDSIHFSIVEPGLLAFVLDKTLSMWGEPITRLKEAVTAAIGALDGEFALTLVTFDSNGYINLPMVPAAELYKSLAISEVNGLTLDCCTSIGIGLDSARVELERATTSAPKNIILVSDGYENTAPWISQVLQSLIGIDSNFKIAGGNSDTPFIIHTFAFGASAPQESLYQLSNLTGGVYTYSDYNDNDLHVITALQNIWQRISGRTLIDRQRFQILTGDTAEFYINLGESDSRIKFGIAWENSNNDIDISLRQPDGHEISSQDLERYAGFDFYETLNGKFYTISAPPEIGLWQIKVVANHVSLNSDIVLDVSSESPVKTSFLPEEYYLKDNPIPIRAQLSLLNSDHPISGATVIANVLLPNSQDSTLIHLYDNGAGVDSIAGDGIYSGALDNSGINYTGNYHVKIMCTGTLGQGVSFQRAVEQDFNITNFIDGMYLNTIAFDSYGNAGAWGDFDADGDQDLAIINNSANIYENDNGHFIQRYSWPVLPKGPGLCATWGDYNNDGNLDIYIGTVGKNLLYKNLGDNQGFVKVQDSTSGITDDALTTFSCAWVDFDNDGDLDLFCANDGQNKMYQNNGDGTFSDVSSLGDLGLDEYSSSSCEWVDYDSDGYIDVAIANKNGPDYIMENGNGLTFRKLSTPSLSDVSHHTTTINWIDYNDDGKWDLFAASDSLLQLFENTDNNTFIYHQLPSDTLHPLVGSRCSSWGDFDNDGKIDLFIGGDVQHDLLFKNLGNNNFQVIKDFLVNYYSLGTHSASWCDFDSDGDLDLLKISSIEAKLYTNDGNLNRWVAINCVADTSQCPQLETTVVLKGEVNGEHVNITRTVSAQTGKAAQNDMRLHFGVYDMQSMDTLRVIWPSGIVNEYYNLPTNVMYKFSENRRIIGGTLNTDLVLDDNIHVIEQLTVPQDVTLSIAPGCLVAFDDNTGIDVKGGKIDILGTSQAPITMFSNSSSPVPGIWNGISIHKSPEVVVHYVEVRDAQTAFAFYGDQQITDLSSMNIHDNGTGIYFESSTKKITINNSHIYNNENFGIWSIMSSVDIMESQIENNAMGGIYSFRKTLMTISNNQIIGNGFAGNENYDGIIAIDGSDLKIFGIESGNPDSCRHNNIIAQNAHAGIHATENAFPLIGIYDPEQPELSGGYNRIYGNDVSIYNENKEPLYAQVNYWNQDKCEQSTPNKLIGEVKWEPPAPVFQGMAKIANYTDTLQLAIGAEISNNFSDALNLYRYLIRSYPDSDWVSIPLNGFRRIVNILNPTPATIIDSLNFYRNTFPNTQLAKWALDETIQPLLELEQYSQALLVLDTLEELWSSTTRIPIYWYERGRISDYLQGQSLDKPSNATVKLYKKILEIYPDSPVAIQVKVRLTIDPSQTPGNKEKIPDTFDLQPPYPNPFNANIRLTYGLPEESEVYIEIYDILGRKMRTFAQGFQPAGYHTMFWNGEDEFGKLTSSGVYFIVIQAGQIRKTAKILYLK